MTKIVILPIQEPWASMIANGEKEFEFRKWIPKWELGQEIWIVATGKAKKPRQVIAKCKYGGTFYLTNGNNLHYDFNRVETKDVCSKAWIWCLKKDVHNIGGTIHDYAIRLDKIEKLEKPFTLESIGIERTPQKYQYISLAKEVKDE